jgi:tetratricopeptide (TPR) repeat protein
VLYPIERHLKLHELIEIYAPDLAARFGSGMSEARIHREGISLLLDAQTHAYQTNTLDVVTALADALIGLHLDAGEFEAARPYAEQFFQLVRDRESATVVARALGIMGVIEYYGGHAELAFTHFSEAFDMLNADEPRSFAGFLLCHAAACLCYLGKYAEASQHFERAEKWFKASGNDLGRAWQQQAYAVHFLCDHGDYERAAALLDAALPLIQDRAAPHATIRNLMGRATCALHLKQSDQAAALLKQLDVLTAKRVWYRPALLLLKGELALALDDPREALNHLRTGIGAVSFRGDMRLLCPLYGALARTLEAEPAQHTNALDAYERSIAVGRTNARQIDLARALHHMGSFLKRTAQRPTEQARSSGFLFEGYQLFMKMSLTPPSVIAMQ